jgi:phospholipase C
MTFRQMAAVIAILSMTMACSTPAALPSPSPTASTPLVTATPVLSHLPVPVRDKIKHIVVIMQENRSLDHYFGTYPGADGIPMQGGVPTVCVPDPKTGQCVKPYHDARDVNAGGPHGAASAAADIDGGKMDGFIAQVHAGRKACKNPDTPGCSIGDAPDVMGWHDAREIPNYWSYAQQFVLQDHMYEPNSSWSLPSHLFMVSGWSAVCTEARNPQSCVNSLDGPKSGLSTAKNDYAWTDLTSFCTVPTCRGRTT